MTNLSQIHSLECAQVSRKYHFCHAFNHLFLIISRFFSQDSCILVSRFLLINVTLSIVSCPLEAPFLIASIEQYTVLETLS